MYLWNLESVEALDLLQGLDTLQLRKVLRLAQLEKDGRLVYVQPLRIRKGWLQPEQVIIDCKKTTKPYGAADTLRPVPEGIVLLVRER